MTRSPACICSASSTRSNEVPIPQNESYDSQNIHKEDDTKKDSGYMTDEQITEDEQDWSEIDYTEMNINHSQGKVLPSVRVSDPGLLLKPDEPNLIIMAKPAGGPSKRDQPAGMDED